MKVKPFEFPKKLDRWKNPIIDERCFIEFLLRNDWVQRKIGIKMKSSNGLFPDVKGEIYDEEGGPIRVEIEYWAENYKKHRHPFGGCDLIISFFRKPNTRVVGGCPVWSFYTGGLNSRDMKYCLLDDINFNFYHNDEDGKTLIPTEKRTSKRIFYDNGKWVNLPSVGQQRMAKVKNEAGEWVEREQKFDGLKWVSK